MVSSGRIRRGVGALSDSVRKYGVVGGVESFVRRVSHQLSSDVQGRSIFEEDWDLCIVLDGCRADELERKRDGFSWLDEVDRYPSLASCTWNWLPRTLDSTPNGVLEETAYVCANPFSDRFCSPDQFRTLDEVWRYAWDSDTGTVLPRPVTDRAIAHGRSTDADRLVVHYMQPHVPFLTDGAAGISRDNYDFDTASSIDDWDRVERGDLSLTTAISWYRETLATVLREVDVLLSNVDMDRVVITADHGEAFGERGLYGHPGGTDLPCLTRVPWVETTATNLETRVPSEYADEGSDLSREERLEALGYGTP